MAPKPIILYDIANTLDAKEATISPNVWKTKLTLIYKRIPYETVRVEFRDIQHTMREMGAPPTGTGPDGTGTYSLPTIRDPATGKVVSESFRIAQYLDEKYPDRRVIPTGTDAQQFAFAENMNAIIGMEFIKVSAYGMWTHLPTYSKPTFEQKIGLPFREMDPPTEEQIEALKPGFNKLAAALDKLNLGRDGLAFGDLVVAAYLMWVRGGVTKKQFQAILKFNDSKWKELIDEVAASDEGQVCKSHLDLSCVIM